MEPSLPMVKGRTQMVTHDYKRNGTTTMFAALGVLTGKISGRTWISIGRWLPVAIRPRKSQPNLRQATG